MKLSESDSKEILTKALKDSFAYCEQVLAKADDSTLGQPVTLFEGQTASRRIGLDTPGRRVGPITTAPLQCICD